MTQAATQRPRKERTENAERRRSQLLAATQKSISTNGLAKTTLATVANEAGLSQGVAVFYFKSKTGLLEAALRDLYSRYDATWRAALKKAGDDPLDGLVALIKADFDPKICNPETLAVWFAFWGEQKFTPQYAAVSSEFDAKRSAALRDICARLMPGASAAQAMRMADWIDTQTDGYWQHLHVFPKTTRRKDAVRGTLEMVAQLIPEQAARILSRV